MENGRFEVDGTFVAVTPDMITGDVIGESEAQSGEDEEDMSDEEVWNNAPGSPAEWLNTWDGRQQTHEMVQRSYE